MRTRRLVGGSLVTSIVLALFAVVLVQAAAAADAVCTLAVEPKTAVAGSEFHLLGSGFTPTELVLQKDGGQPVTIDLDLGDQDPFDIPIGSRKGDEGTWMATAALPGTCSATVEFTATLENTDTIDDLLASTTAQGRVPLGLVMLVIAFGVGGGMLAAWRLRLA